MKLIKPLLLLIISLSLIVKATTLLLAEDSSKESFLAHHLATNAAARAAGMVGGYSDELEFHAPFATNAGQLFRLTNAVWTQTFWLKNVIGLSATPIGFTNLISGQGLPTMVSPRHYLCATHMHAESYMMAFLDTNNVVYFRHTLQRLDVTNDTSVGIIDQDLPPSVGFLPVLAESYTNFLPTTPGSIVQGIGMNQDFCLFGEPMSFASRYAVTWNSALNVPSGLGTNWNVTIRAGDSSNPAMLLIGNQLVLVSHNSFVGGGPNYAFHLAVLNQAMHQLSIKNHAKSDYQLTEFSLTNWPTVR